MSPRATTTNFAVPIPSTTSHSVTTAAPLLRVVGLTKRYANGVLANEEVSFDINAATIHAVIGENGAGKSTVMKMLYGLERPDAGEIWLDGVARRFRSPQEAIAAGIGLVPQHLTLVASMTVAENIVLGTEPTFGPLFDLKRACADTAALADQYGLAVEPNAVVAELSAGVQQRVEILKALRRGGRILLLDEPTALLTPQESESLFASLRQLVESGLTIVLITHKLSEVRSISDCFTVMRAGRVVGGGPTKDISELALSELIMGRELDVAHVPRVDARARAALVQVRHITLVRPRGRPELADISLDIAPGEILGIAGVEGNGQNRLAEVLSGLIAPTLGEARIDQTPVTGAGVRHAQKLGVTCVPEDRLRNGVAPSLSITDNVASLDYYRPPGSHRGVLDRTFLQERARELIRSFGVRAKNEDAAISALSGGNMQKVVVGRELLAQPRFLIACQPTRGVDIGAAEELRRSLVSLRDAGAAVLLISADLDEVLALSDRIAVLFEGRIVAHFAADQVSPRRIGLYMTGIAVDAGAKALLTSPFTVVDVAAHL